MRTLLRNAILFNGSHIGENPVDVVISDGVIGKVGSGAGDEKADRYYDLSGLLLCPGFIDLHCHLRDPGQEWREDIASGSLAGASGGYTTIVCMPNTDPPIDSPALVRYVLEKQLQCKGSRVLPAGCISKDRKGKTLAEIGKMALAGAVLFTDDGSPLSDSNLLRLALQYSSSLGVRIMEHPEDSSLTKGAQVNDGICSTFSGLKGWPASAEAADISRGVSLCRDTGVAIHFTHVSTRDSMDVLRSAKSSGLPVTCDVTPHHLSLHEGSVIRSGYDGVFKVNPPLRSISDTDSLWEGIADGTVDAIATDHAPYHLDEKDLPFQEASFGIASLECAVAAVFNEWHGRGKPCALERLLYLFTSGPSSILPAEWNKLGKIETGSPADLTVIDLDLKRNVDVNNWQSKARLTPWNGLGLKGWPVMTIVGGEPVHIMENSFKGRE